MVLGAENNGGMAAPPSCFVCTREVAHVPMETRMMARRDMNVAVWILSPGVSMKHPSGLVRHSYCAPGTERWAKHMNAGSALDREWSARFG